MFAYLLKRLFLIVPTLLGILLINFCIIQMAPGGPIEQILARAKNQTSDLSSRFGGDDSPQDNQDFHESSHFSEQGIDPQFIEDLKKQFGFDDPLHKRFFKMVKDFTLFDFGKSYFKSEYVSELIKEKLPVSLSLGFWTTLIIYLISIPLGIKKAVRNGSIFDISTSMLIIIGYSVPGFIFALMLIVLFAGGQYVQWFPLRGLVSQNWDQMSLFRQIIDYFWHITLPVTAMVIGGFAKLTLLTKNSFLEELSKNYVLTAKAKGANQNKVLYGHVFRNAILVIVSGFPSTFMRIFFSSSLLIEVLFSLDGLGLLGFEAAMSRDYPVMFATLYIYTLIGLFLHIITDFIYMLIDPRIDLTSKA